MDHKCNKEAEIAEIYTMVEGLDKVINGNGKPGLRDTVVTLTERVNALIEKMDSTKGDRRYSITTVIAIVAVGVAVAAIIIK